MNVEQAIMLSFHYQGNGQVKVYIKSVESTVKICLDTNSDFNLTLLQIRSTPICTGLPSAATLLFNR